MEKRNNLAALRSPLPVHDGETLSGDISGDLRVPMATPIPTGTVMTEEPLLQIIASIPRVGDRPVPVAGSVTSIFSPISTNPTGEPDTGEEKSTFPPPIVTSVARNHLWNEGSNTQEPAPLRTHSSFDVVEWSGTPSTDSASDFRPSPRNWRTPTGIAVVVLTVLGISWGIHQNTRSAPTEPEGAAITRDTRSTDPTPPKNPTDSVTPRISGRSDDFGSARTDHGTEGAGKNGTGTRPALPAPGPWTVAMEPDRFDMTTNRSGEPETLLALPTGPAYAGSSGTGRAGGASLPAMEPQPKLPIIPGTPTLPGHEPIPFIETATRTEFPGAGELPDAESDITDRLPWPDTGYPELRLANPVRSMTRDSGETSPVELP